MKNLLKIIIVAGFVTASFNSLAAEWTITQSATITTPEVRLLQSNQTFISNSRQAINGVVLNGAEDNLVSGSQTARITASTKLELSQTSADTVESSQAVNYIFAKDIVGTSTDVITQTVTVTGETSFGQNAGGGGNVQGGNVMVTSSDGISLTGSIDNAEQAFSGSAQITLLQAISTGTKNVQALNLADTTANSAVTGAVGTLAQGVTASATTEGVLFDSQSQSDNNVQAGNMVDSVGNITALTQTFSAGTTNLVDFQMISPGSTNTQAGNMARTDGTGSVIEAITQTFTGSSTENTFLQAALSSGLVQAGNLIDIGKGAITDLTDHQVFSTGGGSIVMTQTGQPRAGTSGTKFLQALNAITDTTGGTADTQARQSLTTSGAFTMNQQTATDSGQFGNFAGLRW